MDLGLKGKCALVAASSSGLGYATALELAREGCKVVVNGRGDERAKRAGYTIEQETGSMVRAVVGDTGDPAVPQRLVDEAVGFMGGLDLLVTNAGGPPPGGFESLTEAQWETGINLSFMSHVRLIHAALPHLKKSDAASVLTMTSWTVKQPMPNLILSNSVRLATIGLTKSLALELGGDGIRFNSILPAMIDTDRVKRLQEARAMNNGTTLDEEKARDAASSPFGRIGRPDEFAKAAVFLLSPAASYITGLMLVIDGGQYKGMF